MPQYEFHLVLQEPSISLEEQVFAADLDEARDLAEIRLLLTRDVERVTVRRSGEAILDLKRDASHAQAAGQARASAQDGRGTSGREGGEHA